MKGRKKNKIYTNLVLAADIWCTICDFGQMVSKFDKKVKVFQNMIDWSGNTV